MAYETQASEVDTLSRISETCAVPLRSGNWLLYRSDIGAAAVVNQRLAACLSRFPLEPHLTERAFDVDSEVLDQLRDVGFLVEPNEMHLPQSFVPTSITISPTSGCNLACTYCYADAGRERKPALLSMETTKPALDLIIRNAVSSKNKQIGITFHGGGEPISHFKFCQDCIEYAKHSAAEQNLEITVSLATNGVLSRTQIEWIKANVDNIALSIDGDSLAQNTQRPLKSGRPSLPHVLRSIAQFHEAGIRYGVRVTVTSATIARLPEIVSFLCDVTEAPSFHLEPVALSGRAADKSDFSILPEEFIHAFRQSSHIAQSRERTVRYSSGDPYTKRDRFCGAAGNSLVLTPEGNLSTCYEVTRPEDERATQYFVGRVNKDGVQIDAERMSALDSRSVHNIPSCSGCIARYNCSGDCLVRTRTETGSEFVTAGSNRCTINRTLLIDTILNHLQYQDHVDIAAADTSIRDMRLKSQTIEFDRQDTQEAPKILAICSIRSNASKKLADCCPDEPDCAPYCACECLNNNPCSCEFVCVCDPNEPGPSPGCPSN